MARKEKVQVVVPEEQTPEDAPQVENSLEANRGSSTAEGPVALVWKTCDEMEGAKRKDVVEECVVLGVNVRTARTQYQRWFKAQKQG